MDLRPFSITFTDASIPIGDIVTWKWEYRITGTSTWTEFGSSVPSLSNSFEAGYYDIRLTVINPAGSDEETKINYIAVSAGPKRLTTVTSGIVSGDLSVGAFQPVPWASQSSTPGLKTFTQEYTIPTHTNVQWARLYAVVYAAGTDNRSRTGNHLL